MSEFDRNCTVLLYCSGTPPPVRAMKTKLESKIVSTQEKALASTIRWLINGETSYNGLLMTVIRFVVPSRGHRIKKLLQIFWEIVDKCKPDGSLKDEMILVCNALRNDLTSANEYVRGSTLRLLCKIPFLKIVEPLMDPIVSNLTHRLPYVRRNAVLCVFSIVKNFGAEVIPSGLSEVAHILETETDLSTKRNAFLLLLHSDQDKAVQYVLTQQEAISEMGDIFQLALLGLLRMVTKLTPEHKAALLRVAINLLDRCSPAVAFEAATCLLSLTTSPLGLKAAARGYVKLLASQTENNVRITILDRLDLIIAKKCPHALDGHVMDILRALNCVSSSIRKKTLGIVMQLVTPRNVDDVVGVLKREVLKTMGPEMQTAGPACTSLVEYRRLLIRALHVSCSPYPEVSKSLMPLLITFLGEKSAYEGDRWMAAEVVSFVRELAARFPELRDSFVSQILDSLTAMHLSRVLRVSIWIIGEHATTRQDATKFVDTVLQLLRPLPLEPQALGSTKDKKIRNDDTVFKHPELNIALLPNKAEGAVPHIAAETGRPRVTTRTVVLPDGTYGTEEVYEEDVEVAKSDDHESSTNTSVRNLINSGDFLLSAGISVAICKLITRLVLAQASLIDDAPAAMTKSAERDPLLLKGTYIVASLLQHSNRHPVANPKSDGTIRMKQCLAYLCAIHNGDEELAQRYKSTLFSPSSSDAFKVIEMRRQDLSVDFGLGQDGTEKGIDEDTVVPSPQQTIVFRQLRRERLGEDVLLGDSDRGALLDETLELPTANFSKLGAEKQEAEIFQQRLAKSQPLTGLSDPIYVEAFMRVQQFTAILELRLFNRTHDTLQQVTVELCAHGDLKIVERPPPVSLSPHGSCKMSASIKVQSTEAGLVFGYVTYDPQSAVDKKVLVLSELPMDLADYMRRSWLGDLHFRMLWSEFEWENKINVATPCEDPVVFLEHIMRHTNLSLVGREISPTVPPKEDDPDAHRKTKEWLESLPAIRRLEKSSFFAVNLFVRSVFGEEALANLSLETLPGKKLTGSVRIRSRTQGMALALGDKITTLQKGAPRSE
eukprot:Polyplicarium_translucidae@DN2384_c0_g1_i1.p1